MGTNRYTKLTPSRYNPLTLEEIMMVPLARQKKHDKAQEDAGELNMFDVNTLDKDKEVVSGEISDFRSRINSIQDELLSQGYSPSIAKKLLNVKQEREQYLSNEGGGGKAQNSYDQHQALAKSMLSNKNINRAHAAQYLQHSLDRYEGRDAGYTPYYGADTIKIQENVNKLAKDMPTQTLKNAILNDKGSIQYIGGKWGIRNRQGMDAWIQDNLETVKKDPRLMYPVLYNSIINDSESVAFLRAQAESSGVEDVEGYIKAEADYMAQNAAATFKEDNRSYEENLRTISSGSGKADIVLHEHG